MRPKQAGTEVSAMTLSEQADALEQRMSDELDRRVPVKSALYEMGEYDVAEGYPFVPPGVVGTGRTFLMGHDRRLPKMPDRPTLVDFFKYRFGPMNHVLQSARLARESGHEDKVVLACLLHDIANFGFIRADHGFWGAQLVEPYVDEEVSWAIRAHQTLRFYPDPEAGYEYPKAYVEFFGPDFKPEPYVEALYRQYRKHKWYETARLITVNDLYAFDPNKVVTLDEFTDLIERSFRQPEEGLGFDDSPSAHMWRTINWPTRFL